jgi:hypothetical protein
VTHTYTRSYPVTYRYYQQFQLRAGQTLTTGSPAAAALENAEPLQVWLLRRQTDPQTNEETDAVVMSFDLDPGESVDTAVVENQAGGTEQIQVRVLSGTVAVDAFGRVATLTEGQTSVLDTVPPPAPQSIAFDDLPNRLYGDGPFSVAASSTSGLPVSFTATGACLVNGTVVTLSGWNECAITAAQAGNESFAPTSVTRRFYVFHSWSNVAQPVNANGTSVFKAGSTVPVKFQLTGASATVSTLQPRLSIARIASGVVGTELEATSSASADSGNVFRYDSTAGQYVFNWGTRGLAEGTWQIRIDLQDGQANRVVTVSLKK